MAGVERLHFPSHLRKPLEPYLPDLIGSPPNRRPFITLTYACSLDSQIAVAPGAQTVLSGPASKAMTHYLRTKHDAILVGSGTFITDDPGLNSRLSDAVDAGLDLQPRPIILDKRGRTRVDQNSKVIMLAKEGRGRAPYVFQSPLNFPRLEHQDRSVDIHASNFLPYHDFIQMLETLYDMGIRSIMIEGGAQIINTVLSEHAGLVDSLIVTYAPVFLGQGGVTVCPPKPAGSPTEAVARYQNVTWLPLEDDVVMCAKSKR